jgi:hypothetical protein
MKKMSNIEKFKNKNIEPELIEKEIERKKQERKQKCLLERMLKQQSERLNKLQKNK